MSLTRRQIDKWTEILAAINEARLDDIAEWTRISEWLRDHLTPAERQFFIRQLQQRMDRLNELLNMPDEAGAGGR